MGRVGELSADVHAELRAEFERSQEKLLEQNHADAVQDIGSEHGTAFEK